MVLYPASVLSDGLTLIFQRRYNQPGLAAANCAIHKSDSYDNFENMGELDSLWHRINDELAAAGAQENGISIVEVAGRKICVTRFGEKYYGFAWLCPHASGIMANGRIDERGNVVCPVHKYKFSIQNGRNITGEGYHLKTYPVEIRDTGIFVRL